MGSELMDKTVCSSVIPMEKIFHPVNVNTSNFSASGHTVLPRADHSKVSVEISESVALDSLESILRVLFQLTEESDFKLVSDKQQLGTQRGI